MTRNEYTVAVEIDDNTPVLREEIEFQDFSSGSGVDGKTAQDKQQISNDSGFSDATFFDQNENTRSEQNEAPIWSIVYYSQYFNVDTNQVLLRAAKSFYPKERFSEVVGSNPDLYGPFWISTTVIFLFFVTSSIAGTIASFIDQKDDKFDLTILSFAVAAIYSYSFGIPLLVWITLKYFGCKPSLMGILGLYGYGLTVWIPISVLCIIPNEIIRWTLVITGFAISGFFKTRNLYPIISTAEAKTFRLILIFILVAHAAFALLLKFEFFSYPIKNT
ncbi:hypothetical protein Glove_217g55 [Diversispora epigaea]|uniref:Protein YIP n=1 Tax=Diversispora epigaea TaxID=1348612 RepID=A0A397IN37_9GLOM|nr:hypothetical protein Glove_217g55 [Diversispora epigaea]